MGTGPTAGRRGPSVVVVTASVDLILPCRDEGLSLECLLPQVPAHLNVLVVDNGSRDDTAAVAARHGALVVTEPTPGYGAAVHAGLDAATAEIVAVMDGDGSFDPALVPGLVAELERGDCDMIVGRRRPVSLTAWPWHARMGNRLVVAILRHRVGLAVHDIAPLRVCARQALVDLGVADRRFGYPVELLLRATQANWRIVERDVAYRPRVAGTRSKVSGSVRGTLRTALDFWRVLR